MQTCAKPLKIPSKQDVGSSSLPGRAIFESVAMQLRPREPDALFSKASDFCRISQAFHAMRHEIPFVFRGNRDALRIHQLPDALV